MGCIVTFLLALLKLLFPYHRYHGSVRCAPGALGQGQWCRGWGGDVQWVLRDPEHGPSTAAQEPETTQCVAAPQAAQGAGSGHREEDKGKILSGVKYNIELYVLYLEEYPWHCLPVKREFHQRRPAEISSSDKSL